MPGKQIAAGCSTKPKNEKRNKKKKDTAEDRELKKAVSDAAAYRRALRKKGIKLRLICSDGKYVDAGPFVWQSVQVTNVYGFEWKTQEVNFNSDIIKKVSEFCEERGKIEDDPATVNDEVFIQKKLKAFHEQFREHNKTDAIDLISVALDMEIKSLLDLMMEDVVCMFTNKTADEAYKILPVYLKEYNHKKFQVMVELLNVYVWAFKAVNKPGKQIAAASQRENMQDKRIAEAKQRIANAKATGASSYDPLLIEYLERARENNNWDPELLKVSFNEFTYLSPLEKRHWLIAHFLIRGFGDVLEAVINIDSDDDRYKNVLSEDDD